MRVAYITTRFPSSSETFASTDVRVLRDAGLDLSVHTMRPPLEDPIALLRDRGLCGLPVSHGTFLSSLKGVLACLRHPVRATRLVMWLFVISWTRPDVTTHHVGDNDVTVTAQERFRNLTVVQFLISLAFVPRTMQIFAELQRLRPDVVHLFWGHYPCMVGYLVMTELPDVVVSVFLGAHDLTRRYGGSAWVVPRADLVSTHAKWNFGPIEALGAPRDRIHLAYRGIDPARFHGDGVGKIRHRIVCAGRLEEGKGIDDVIRAFGEIHGRCPTATLAVLGQGRDRAALEQLSQSLHIDGAVRFLGHVPHADVARELCAAEVFLHMSWDDTERLPNVVKEAMASRCLCIVTRTRAIEELVQDGRNGFLVPPRDVKAAARRVNDIFSGSLDVAPMLKAASDHIAACFDVTQSMRSYMCRWQDALARRRTPVLVTLGIQGILTGTADPHQEVDLM